MSSSNDESTPRAAFVIAGLLRGFTHHVVWQSILSNAVRAFGAEPHLYLYLKYENSFEQLLAENITARLEPRPTVLKLWSAEEDHKIVANPKCPPPRGMPPRESARVPWRCPRAASVCSSNTC